MDKYTIFDFGLLHLEWTNALFVLIVFSICAFCMNKLLFQPIIKTIKNRKIQQAKGSKKIEELEQSIQKAQEEISSMHKDFQLKMVSNKEKQIKEVKNITDKMILETRQKLEKEKQNFRQKLVSEVENLEKNIDDFSDKILNQIKQKIV